MGWAARFGAGPIHERNTGTLLSGLRLPDEFAPFSRIFPSARLFGPVRGVDNVLGQGRQFAIGPEVLEEILLVPELNFSEVIKGGRALMRSRVGSLGDEL